MPTLLHTALVYFFVRRIHIVTFQCPSTIGGNTHGPAFVIMTHFFIVGAHSLAAG